MGYRPRWPFRVDGSSTRDFFCVYADRSNERILQPLGVVGLLLIAGGVVWALVRGLHFYGLSPVDAAYDLDQPPLLLALVGGWLLYRSRRR
jgi:hypothetical protein